MTRHPDARVVWARREAFREAIKVGLSLVDAREHADQVARYFERNR